jgi:hypothetical protein
MWFDFLFPPPLSFIIFHAELLLNHGGRQIQDIKIAVLSSVVVFIVSSTFFFSVGCLCHHLIIGHKRDTGTVAETSADATLQHDNIVINQQNLEVELTANVAYTSVHLQ